MTNRALAALVPLSILAIACGDDGTAATSTDGSDTSGGGTSFTTTTATTTTLDDTGSLTSDSGGTSDSGSSGATGESTGVDESSSGGPATDGSTSDGSGTDTGSGSGSDSGSGSTGMASDCGNDTIDAPEVCDGTDLASQDCTMQGFDSGTLGCLEDCSDFDLSGCTLGCGNNLIEAAEVCDGTDLASQSCLTQNFGGGTLVCANDCSAFDTTGCIVAPPCVEESLGSAVGAAVAMGNTDAEDEDLEQSCVFAGAVDHVLFWIAPTAGFYQIDTFGSGYDTVLAIYGDCDSATELSCNDDNFSAQSSLLRNFDAGQQVIIAVSGWNGSTGDWVLNINEVELSGPCCAAHNSPGCSDPTCAADVCEALPECCVAWNQPMCAGLANVFCDICNTDDICGNNVLEGNETCDGLQIGGATCQSEGFDAGQLTCLDDCTGLDTSGCYDFSGNCCAAHQNAGCMDATCSSELCMADPFCCEFGWDGICANEANVFCDICNTPDVCGNNVLDGMNEACDGAQFPMMEDCVSHGHDGGQLTCNDDCTVDDSACFDYSGDCCAPHGNPGCDDDACVAIVCGADPFCCNVAWDNFCTGAALNNCAVCV